MSRFSGEMVFRCGQVEIRGRQDRQDHGFECELFVDGRKVSEQFTYLASIMTPPGVLSAVRGAISFALEDKDIDENLLETEMNGRRWKVEKVR